MSVAAPPADDLSVPLREHLLVLRLHKWTILLLTLMITAAAVGYSYQQAEIFVSESKVLVKPVSVSPGQGAGGVPPNLETEREIANSEAVTQIAAESLGKEVAAIRSKVSIEVATATEILVFRYSAFSPNEAKAGADAVAEAYLEFRRQQVVDDLLFSSETVQSRVDDMNEQLAEINDQLDEVRTETGDVAPGTEAAERALETQAASLIVQIAVLEEELSELSPAENLRVGQIVEQADVPTGPSRPNHVRNGLLGLIVGLIAGVGLAFLKERLNDAVRGREDLEALVGAPVLAVIPRVIRWRQRQRELLVTLEEPHSTASEAFRTLRTRVLFALHPVGAKTLVVTSAHAGEGKTSTTANLGIALAQAGKRVIIVSADFRKPRLHRFFGLKNQRGLTDVLVGDILLSDAIKPTKVDKLRLIPTGTVPPNPAELLGSDAMGRVLGELREIADLVVIDAPPALVVSDVIALAPLAEAAIILADAGTARHSISQTRQQLEQVNVPVVGTILNGFDPTKSRTYATYSTQYYSSYGEESSGKKSPLSGGVKRSSPRAKKNFSLITNG